MKHELSPFLGRDYRHLADYAPAGTTRDERIRADRFKAKMLIDRLLFKKFDRSGALKTRLIQRLGDHGRRYAAWYALGAYAIWRLTRAH